MKALRKYLTEDAECQTRPRHNHTFRVLNTMDSPLHATTSQNKQHTDAPCRPLAHLQIPLKISLSLYKVWVTTLPNTLKVTEIREQCSLISQSSRQSRIFL